MRKMLAVFVPLLACNVDTVSLEGTLWSAPYGAVPVLEDSEIALMDQTGSVFSSVRTNADGQFSVSGPSAQRVYLVVQESPQTRRTSFTGVTGVGDSVSILDLCLLPDCQIVTPEDRVHPIYGMTSAEVDRLTEVFQGCEGWESATSVIIGTLRYSLFSDSGESPPLVQGATLSLEGFGLSDPVDACYLNDEGTAYSADANGAGTSQTFAFFSVDSGPYTLVLEHEIVSGLLTRSIYPIYVPNDGIVPRFPLWVDFVLP